MGCCNKNLCFFAIAATTMALVCALLLFPLSPADAAESLEFSFQPEPLSVDLGAILTEAPRYPALPQDKYKAVGADYLVREAEIVLTTNDRYRLLLVCKDIASEGWLRGIQLAVVDERTTPATVIQRVSLGDGLAPQMLSPALTGAFGAGGRETDLMLRVIRRGNNTEAYVYGVNPVTGRLREALRVNRSLPERLKLDIRGTMQDGGYVDVAAKKPAIATRVDLSESLAALVEDELYQPDGRPIAALQNLTCVRHGWEEEGIYMEEGKAVVSVGLSLITLSRKQVVDVAALFEKNAAGEWEITRCRFEPFLPYRN